MRAAIGHLLDSSPDWPAALAMAHRHRVLPLLRAGLLRAGARPPPEVLARLQAAHLANVARTTALIAEAERIADWFDGAGIRHLLWRGPAIAAAAYPEPALRQFDDLDFLVDPPDALRACRLLDDHGYQPHAHLRPAQLRAYLRSGWEYVATDTGDHWIELAAAAAPRIFAFDVPFERLWAARRTVKLDRREVAAPSDAQHLLLAAAHGAKHLWQRLQWIADLQALLHASPALPDGALFALARSTGSRRMLALGLALAQELMGAPLTAVAQAEIARDPEVGRLAAQAAGWLNTASDPRPGTRAMASFQRAARERGADRARSVFRTVFAPSYGDWSTVALPAFLEPIYWLIRPMRIALQVLAGRRQLPGK